MPCVCKISTLTAAACYDRSNRNRRRHSFTHMNDSAATKAQSPMQRSLPQHHQQGLSAVVCPCRRMERFDLLKSCCRPAPMLSRHDPAYSLSLNCKSSLSTTDFRQWTTDKRHSTVKGRVVVDAWPGVVGQRATKCIHVYWPFKSSRTVKYTWPLHAQR